MKNKNQNRDGFNRYFLQGQQQHPQKWKFTKHKEEQRGGAGGRKKVNFMFLLLIKLYQTYNPTQKLDLTGLIQVKSTYQ